VFTLLENQSEMMQDAKKRLHQSRQLNILDSQYEALYNSITKLAAKITHMPVVIITLSDENRIWIKSVKGLNGIEDGPSQQMYGDWLFKTSSCLEIADISKDYSYSEHPFVNGETKFMFYAAAPITLPLGEIIGVLSVFDIKPNKLDPIHRDVLFGLTQLISNALVIKSFTEKNLSLVTESAISKYS